MNDLGRGIETSAASVLKRAVEHDQRQEYSDSLVCYREGIQLLLNALKSLPDDDAVRRGAYRAKITQYMDRAEKVKELDEERKKAQKYNEQYRIADGAVGYSYNHVFSKLLTADLSCVEVDDPYIRSVPQIFNFIRFCEMLVKSAAPVNTIRLLTTRDSNDAGGQTQKLNKLQESLSQHNVSLHVELSETLHDREIRFNNGWIVKIGRGLDYFKPVDKFTVGYCDYDLRPCKETTVDIIPASRTNTR